ncbi:MAG: hypothetical protein KGL35_01385 [Bradyrhizobium sp.]|nr:hypothetical protein [Bradyrhizobium sp.]
MVNDKRFLVWPGDVIDVATGALAVPVWDRSTSGCSGLATLHLNLF